MKGVVSTENRQQLRFDKLSHAVIVMLFLGIIILVLGVATPSMAATGVNVDAHSQEEIREYYRTHQIESYHEVSYKKKPVTKAPYSPGELSDDTLDSALETLNFIRYIAGLDANVTLDDSYNEKMQAGVLINAVNDELSHTPSKPAKMSDDLYNLGVSGTKTANIAMGFTDLNTAIQWGCMACSEYAS